MRPWSNVELNIAIGLKVAEAYIFTAGGERRGHGEKDLCGVANANFFSEEA